VIKAAVCISVESEVRRVLRLDLSCVSECELGDGVDDCCEACAGEGCEEECGFAVACASKSFTSRHPAKVSAVARVSEVKKKANWTAGARELGEVHGEEGQEQPRDIAWGVCDEVGEGRS
jgi:hypothetical protein